MPISYDIDAATGVLSSVFTGKVPPGEILDWYDELQGHPDFRPDLIQIAEFRMSEADWTPEEMKEVVTREPFGPGARRAPGRRQPTPRARQSVSRSPPRSG